MTREPPAHVLAFLDDLETQATAHKANRSLKAHLVATWRILAQWDAPEPVALAGLLHSIYGTEAFDVATLPPTPRNRARVRALVGAEAEDVAYRFCALHRDEFLRASGQGEISDRFGPEPLPVSPGQAAALAEILLANEVDLAIAKTGPDQAKIVAKVAPVYQMIRDRLPVRVRAHAVALGLPA